MNNVFYLSVFLFFLQLPLLTFSAKKQIYIAYFGGNSEQKTVQEIQEKHHSYLLSVKKTEEEANQSLIYTYNNINGFSALLTREEASKLSEMEEVVSVFPSRTYSLHTTRSWDFTKLLEGSTNSNGMWEDEEEHSSLKSKYGEDVVVGVIDTGIWPESESFNDIGMGPIPKSWKGTCESGDAFNSSHCNKKLIGARYFIKGYEAKHGKLKNAENYRSPRDKEGHGTHTSSTAVGRVVRNISSLGGYARGTATGGAPLARLAMYKVCWPKQCTDVDILAGIDGAIDDGVDVISISMGPFIPIPYNENIIAIGTLHAIQKNIAVALSAGNSGPAPATVANVAPWAIAVGASSVDRIFPSSIVLGNGGAIIAGESISPYKMENKLYPLAYADQVAYNTNNVSKNLSGQCLPGVLSPTKAKGKIILCLRGGDTTRVGAGMEVKRAGGVGLVLGNNKASGNDMTLDVHFLPAVSLNYTNALKILKYINSANQSNARLVVGGKTVLYVKPAPFMTSFSSRGPSKYSPSILKPDITAPGLNILAAWSQGTSPTRDEEDHRVVKYNFLTGTSMSCPHVAAALALVKGMHPNWSSAALRSALMTSATLTNNEGNLITDEFGDPADPFQFGSGHFRPTKAVDPGLVYDASYNDYLLFLCGLGYKKMDHTFNCPKQLPSLANLNYPSLAIPELKDTVTVVRTVTNVGSGQSVYTVNIKSPPGISIKISPDVLHFNHVGQKMNFTITIKNEKCESGGKKGEYRFGSFTWSDKLHLVRSPIAISVAH